MTDMPKEIWINNAEFKLVDALRQKEPRAIGSSKYIRADLAETRSQPPESGNAEVWEALEGLYEASYGCGNLDNYQKDMGYKRIRAALTKITPDVTKPELSNGDVINNADQALKSLGILRRAAYGADVTITGKDKAYRDVRTFITTQKIEAAFKTPDHIEEHPKKVDVEALKLEARAFLYPNGLTGIPESEYILKCVEFDRFIDHLNERGYIRKGIVSEDEVEAALKDLSRCEWHDESCDASVSAGYDCDDASDLLTRHHKTIRKLLIAHGGGDA